MRSPSRQTRRQVGRLIYGIAGVLTLGILLGPGAAPAAAQCDCPWVGDVDANGTTNVLDLSQLLDAILVNGPVVQDPNCPAARVDFNADGFIDIRDLTPIVDNLFLGGGPILDPCDCVSQPQLCDPAFDPTPGDPGNSVVVESKTVVEGTSGVTVNIALANDVPIRSIVVPLAIREVTPGAFITSLHMAFTDRLTDNLTILQRRIQYANPDGTCPNGFSTFTSNNSPNPVPVSSSPRGAMFMASRFFEADLPAGSDVTGSLVLTMDVTAVTGTFEIDTTCTDPNNHVLFVRGNMPDYDPIVPAFTKGVITIAPNTPPVAVCQAQTVSVDDACAEVDVSVDGGSYDPDGGTVTVTQSPPGPYPLGETSVTLTVEDASGATDQCVTTVTVEDNTPPVITCPADININIPPVYTGWVVAYTATATDNCPGAVTVSYSQNPGTFFPNGQTEVTCTATDAAGNTAECSFFVTITAECYDRMGDVNCDGTFDALDLNLIINALFFGETIPPCSNGPQ